jgi:hypothetical protein
MDEIIFSYTNEDALADGLFVDVSETAKKYGFMLPFYCASNIYGQGEALVETLMLEGNMKIFKGEFEDGTIVQLEDGHGIIWLMIEGTCKEDAVFKLFYKEDY